VKTPHQPTALDAFLQNASRGGTADSTGSFTADISRALEKLAKFQLGSESAWLLKCIQWGVASGASEIKVVLGKKSTEIHLLGQFEIDTQDVEEAIVTVEPATPALEHLSVALRDVGFRQGRAFQLGQPNSNELTWDGKKLHRSSRAVLESLVLIDSCPAVFWQGAKSAHSPHYVSDERRRGTPWVAAEGRWAGRYGQDFRELL
jgi:hypothetical protein